MNLKTFIQKDRPAKLVGGPADGGELFVPIDAPPTLNIPIIVSLTRVCDANLGVLDIRHAAYEEQADRYHWQFVGMKSTT